MVLVIVFFFKSSRLENIHVYIWKNKSCRHTVDTEIHDPDTDKRNPDTLWSFFERQLRVRPDSIDSM